jgi:GNAT superfamily N-acetyltransferase
MIEEVTIDLVERPGPDLVRTIEAGLDAYNAATAGAQNPAPFALVMKNDCGEIVGGLFAVTFWSGLAIELLWVAEAYRGAGYGRTLLTRAEAEGHRRGAKKAFLNTHTFQAPGFYEKLGYELYGELRDFPPGYDRRYYVKTL